jgi:hypothetical protein
MGVEDIFSRTEAVIRVDKEIELLVEQVDPRPRNKGLIYIAYPCCRSVHRKDDD